MRIPQFVSGSAARRLLFLVVWLVAADALVPSLLTRLEKARYESDDPFRFEGSDLFGLGPIVAYLRENPRTARPRTVFLGNSVIFGYKLTEHETIPAFFQRLNPGQQVLNLAINNMETGSSYLIAKQLVDSVDTLYVLIQGTGAISNLSRMIDVAPEDRKKFGIREPEVLEDRLQGSLAFWRLYRDAYRLQNAAFGSSTRMFIYQNKAVWARWVLGFLRGVPSPALSDHTGAASTNVTATIDVTRPVSGRQPSPARLRELSTRHRVLWDFCALVFGRRRHLVLLDFVVHSKELSDEDAADMNEHFAPFVSIVQVAIPHSLVFDSQHLTAEGSAIAAHALSEWQQSMARTQ